MKKNLFERIADIITGTSKNKSEKQTTGVFPNGPEKQDARGKGENTSNDNSISKKKGLLTAILSRLKENYIGQRISFDKKVLTIWVQDNLFYNSIVESDFKEELITSLNVELGFSFGTVEIKSGKVPEQAALTEVCPNVLLQISTVETEKVIKTAKIYPVEGNGSTLEEMYVLDSQEIRKMPDARYNIGIGKHPVMSDNSRRENHIAIDDDPLSPQFSKNRYVSRSHAYITFSEEYGFLLHVEFGGTRTAQKRTHIYRGSDKIELNNILIPEPLKSGDYIVLSKYVHLLFQEF